MHTVLILLTNLACLAFAVCCLFSRRRRFLVSYLLFVPLAATYFSDNLGSEQLRLYQGDVRELLTLILMPVGAFWGALFGWQLANLFNRLFGLREPNWRPLVRSISEASRTVTIPLMGVGALGVMSVLLLSIYAVNFPGTLEQQARLATRGKQYCIVDSFGVPVQTFKQFRFWKMFSETAGWKLGISAPPGSITGWGNGWSRRIHLGVVSEDSTYYWSFSMNRFLKSYYIVERDKCRKF